MNCAICGKDNQPGTRFCVHCGAALAVAPAGAVLTTGVSSVMRPVTPPAASVPPSRPAPPPPPESATAPRPVAPAPNVPAYDVAPKRSGVVLLLIGLAALVAVGGYIGYKVFGVPPEVRDTLTKGEAPSTAPPAAAPSTATPNAPGEIKPAEDKTTAPSAATAMPPAGAPESGKSLDETAPKAEVKAAPPKPSGTPSSKNARPPATAQMIPAPAVAPAPVPRPAAPANGASSVTPPVQDRWAQMGDELRRCQREDFLSRVVCDQRVRLRFCDGYWGKVAQCPGGIANPDRGQ
jgi:hypothetical protein